MYWRVHDMIQTADASLLTLICRMLLLISLITCKKLRALNYSSFVLRSRYFVNCFV